MTSSSWAVGNRAPHASWCPNRMDSTGLWWTTISWMLWQSQTHFQFPESTTALIRLEMRARYVSKFDLLTGYWQVPLTDREKMFLHLLLTTTYTSTKWCLLGMKNASATFQRMMRLLLNDLRGCEVYINDLIIYSTTWEEHLGIMRKSFLLLEQSNLSVNLHKSEFGQANVNFLGHIMGQGYMRLVIAKVGAIINYPAHANSKQFMRFLSMVGFYRKFCRNFAETVSPLTDLLKKNKKCVEQNLWQGLSRIKSILIGHLVLSSPNFEKQFKLIVDASVILLRKVFFNIIIFRFIYLIFRFS